MKKKISVILLSAIFAAQAANAGYVFKIATPNLTASSNSGNSGSGGSSSGNTGSIYDNKPDTELVTDGVAKGGTPASDTAISDLTKDQGKADGCELAAPELIQNAGVYSFAPNINLLMELDVRTLNGFYGGANSNRLLGHTYGKNAIVPMKSGYVSVRTQYDLNGSEERFTATIPDYGPALLLKDGFTMSQYNAATSDAERVSMTNPINNIEYSASSQYLGADYDWSAILQLNNELYYASSKYNPGFLFGGYAVLGKLGSEFNTLRTLLSGRRLIHGTGFSIGSDGSIAVTRKIAGEYSLEFLPDIVAVDATTANTANGSGITLIVLTSSGQVYNVWDTGNSLQYAQYASNVVKLIKSPLNAQYVAYIKSDGSFNVRNGVETKMPAAPAGYTIKGFVGDLFVATSKNKVAVRYIFGTWAGINEDMVQANFLDDSMETKDSLKSKATTDWVYSKDICELVVI